MNRPPPITDCFRISGWGARRLNPDIDRNRLNPDIDRGGRFNPDIDRGVDDPNIRSKKGWGSSVSGAPSLGATVQATLSSSSAGPLMAEALVDVMGDATIKLSPQSQILGSAVTTVLEGAVGQALTSLASDLAASMLGTVATAAVTDCVAELAGNIPLLGTIVQWASFVVDDIMGLSAEEALERKTFFEACQRVQSFFKPVPTGHDSNRVPSDVFGLYDVQDAQALNGIYIPKAKAKAAGLPSAVEAPGIVDHNGTAYGMSWQAMPMLGTCLITITEGAPPYGNFTVPTKEGGLRIASYDELTRALRIKYQTKTFGVPAKRRAQFRKLRLAIQAQRKPNPRGTTDGGVSLWPIYLDMLRAEYDAGHLGYQYVHDLIRAATTCDPALPTLQIRELVRSWELKQEPWYAAGVEEQKQAATLAHTIALRMRNKSRSLLANKLGSVKKARMIRQAKVGAGLGAALYVLAKLLF